MIDWTRLLAESFRQFMTDEGITGANLKDKLTPELLKRFLEKFAGTADPDALRRQLADAPGAVGFFISFMLALPAEGRFASVLILSEVMKAAGLPIPHGVRTAVIAAFEATGEVGVTDEDIQRYRARVLTAVSGVTPTTVATAGFIASVMAMLALIYSRFTHRQIESAPPALEDKPMSTPPDPTDPSLTVPPVAPVVSSSPSAEVEPPEPTDKNKIRFLEFLSAVKPLREAEVLVFPKRQNEYWRGVGWVRKHLHDKNLANRRRARRAFDLLPVDLIEGEREKLKKPLDELFKLNGPRTKRPSVADRRDYTEQVHVWFNRASAWEAEVREIGRTECWFWQRHLTIPLYDKLDDAVNDDVRGTFEMLLHFALISLAGLAAYQPFTPDDFVERSGMIRLAVCGGLIGASLLTLIGQAIAHSGFIDRLYTGKNLDGSERDRTTVEVMGSLGMIVSLAGGTALLAYWLAPGFTPLTFALNCCLFGVWGAAFAALINDPWENEVKPVFFTKVADSHGQVSMVPVIIAPSADAHAKDHPKADDKHGKKDDKAHDKGHGKDDHGEKAHAPAGSPDLNPLIVEKQEKLKLVVPGIQRPGVLKTSMGATLVGALLNFMWALTATVIPAFGFFVTGFFTLLTILTVSQYFNALIEVEWMKKFIKTTVAQSFFVIIAFFVLSLGFAAAFSGAGQVKIVGLVHGKTDQLLGVSSADQGEESDSQELASSTESTRQTHVSTTTTVTRTSSCPDRDRLEAQSAGICTRNADYIGCQCP